MKRGIFWICLPLLLVLTSCSRDPKAYVNTGNTFFAKAKYKEAALMYKKAYSKDPKYGEAYYRLALADMQMGALGEAVFMLRRAVELQPDNTDAAVQLANLYLAYATRDRKQGPQLLEDAATLTGKLLAKDPNSYDGHRLAGQIALVKNDPPTAVQELKAANQLKPYQPELVMAYYEALVRNNQEPAAETLARDFIGKEKNFGQIYDRLYIQYMIGKRLTEAEQILKLKTENNPKSATYLLQLATHYVVVNRRSDMDAVMQRLINDNQFPDRHLMAGDFYLFRLREFDPAKQQYEAGIAAFPKDKAVYQKRLVELYVTSGNNAQATQLVTEILKNDPKDTDGIAMRAALMLSSGSKDQINEAALDLQSLVAKNATNHLLKYNYARALLAQNKPDQAILQLEDAIKARPDFIAAREMLARLYVVKADGAKALQVSEELLQLDPNNLTGHLSHTAALLAMGSRDKARAELDLIAKLFPQNPDAGFQVGLLAFEDKDYKKAEQVFGALYRDNPRDPRGLKGITETLAAQNRLNDAIKEMDKAIAAEPDRRDLKLIRANFYARAERYDDAIATFKALLEKEPASADLLYKLAETYRRKGDINAAADTFRKSSQAAPNNTLPLIQLGMILETIGPPEQTKAVYEQILKINPDEAIALNNLAYRKAEEGTDLDAALAMAQKARQIRPDATMMADTLGWIYIKKNLSADAERIFKDLVQKEPANPTFHYHYAMALMQKGDKPSARRELETALRNKPSKDEANKIQDALVKL